MLLVCLKPFSGHSQTSGLIPNSLAQRQGLSGETATCLSIFLSDLNFPTPLSNHTVSQIYQAFSHFCQEHLLSSLPPTQFFSLGCSSSLDPPPMTGLMSVITLSTAYWLKMSIYLFFFPTKEPFIFIFIFSPRTQYNTLQLIGT